MRCTADPHAHLPFARQKQCHGSYVVAARPAQDFSVQSRYHHVLVSPAAPVCAAAAVMAAVMAAGRLARVQALLLPANCVAGRQGQASFRRRYTEKLYVLCLCLVGQMYVCILTQLGTQLLGTRDGMDVNTSGMQLPSPETTADASLY